MSRIIHPKFYFMIAVAFLLQISCAGKKDVTPRGIIPKDKMIDLFVDVHLAESSSDNHGFTVMQINKLMAAKYDTLFKKHRTNYTAFKTSYDYYMDHPQQLSDIYTEVVNRLTTMESKMTTSRKIPHISKPLSDSLPHSPK